MKIYAFLSLALILSGCASVPPSTGYVTTDSIENFGSYIKPVKDGAYISVYRGNSQTKPVDAYAYSILAGYDQCSKDHKIGYVSKPENLSQSSSSSALGSYSVPHYHKSGATTYDTQYYTYDVNSTYPNFIATFFCREHFVFFKQDLTLVAIKAELVHDVTKDFHGGLLVKATKQEGQTFHVDDVIIRVGSHRVDDGEDASTALEQEKSGRVRVELIRNQKIVKTSAEVKDLTATFKEIQDRSTEYLCKLIPKKERADTLGVEHRDLPAPASCTTAAVAAK